MSGVWHPGQSRLVCVPRPDRSGLPCGCSNGALQIGQELCLVTSVQVRRRAPCEQQATVRNAGCPLELAETNFTGRTARIASRPVQREPLTMEARFSFEQRE